uniref:ATP synthase complex subunit 8 n=1 Tax=Uroplatus fimbriatus TaxID=402375 RepID=A0A0A1HAL0_9SAUR|nr:ATP synthase F0 subunit 8 [Uroplatus fimbriatus]BAP90247.1 ATPase subunit 8 [Uroplatus fimbriatus]
MPQLNPALWFTTWAYVWLLMLLIFNPMMSYFHPLLPPTNTINSFKPHSWHWPWP